MPDNTMWKPIPISDDDWNKALSPIESTTLSEPTPEVKAKVDNENQWTPTPISDDDWNAATKDLGEIKAPVVKPKESDSDFIPGVKRGVDQLQAMGHGAVALAGSFAKKVGAEETGQAMQNFGMEGYRRNIEEAGQNPKKHSFKDVYTGKAGLGGAIDWTQGTLGELVPSMVEAAIGAAVGSLAGPGIGTATGGLAGRTVLKKGIDKLVKEGMEKGIGDLTEAQLRKQVTNQAMKKLGGKVGMGAAVLPMESGGNYAGLLEEKGIDAPETALFFGALATSLEYAGGNSKLIDTFIDALGSGKAGLAKRTAKDFLTQIPQEALQEGGQEAFSIMNTVANTDEEFFTPENIEQIIESMGAGAVGGSAGSVANVIASSNINNNNEPINEPGQDPAIDPITDPEQDEEFIDTKIWVDGERDFEKEKEIAIKAADARATVDENFRQMKQEVDSDLIRMDSGELSPEEFIKKHDLDVIASGLMPKLSVDKEAEELNNQINNEDINVEPTEGQKEAGNYKKIHVKVDGFNITIENPDGSIRSGKDQDGEEWSSQMHGHYGYFKRTEGKDGDQVDAIIDPVNRSGRIFVVNQVDPTTKEFDEHKVIVGSNTIEEAEKLYLSNYDEGWQGLDSVVEMNKADFKEWLNDGKRTKKPVTEKDESVNEPVSFTNEQQGEKQDIVIGENTRIKLSDVEKTFPGQRIIQANDNTMFVAFKNGKGLGIKVIEDVGNGFVSMAINTGEINKNGKILGVTQGNEILLDKDFADNVTLWHENKHVLDNLGMITEADNSALNKEFNKLLKEGGLGFTPSTAKDSRKAMEENRASMFAQIMLDREAYRNKPLGKVIQRILDLFQQLLNFGQQSVAGLAREVESGKIYERQALQNNNNIAFDVKLPNIENIANRISHPFGNYLGNKKKIIQDGYYNEFLNKGSQYNNIYDVFGGSGLISKAFASANGKNVIYNELDPDVFNSFQTIKNQGAEVITQVQIYANQVQAVRDKYPKGGLRAHNEMTKFWAQLKKDWKESSDPIKNAAAFSLLKSKSTGHNRAQNIIKSRQSGAAWRTKSNPVENIIPELQQHISEFQDINLVSQDARNIGSQISKGDLVIFDPPYVSKEDSKVVEKYAVGKDLATISGAIDFINTTVKNAINVGADVVYTNTYNPKLEKVLKDIGMETQKIAMPSNSPNKLRYELLGKYNTNLSMPLFNVANIPVSKQILAGLINRKTETDTPAFKEWFGKSVARNKENDPLVFYHGTNEVFEEFSKKDLKDSRHLTADLGHFFTLKKGLARKYGQHQMPVYLKLEQPYKMSLDEAQSFDSFEDSQKFQEDLKAKGYDSIVIETGDSPYIVTFDSGQAKSIHNQGDWQDPSNVYFQTREDVIAPDQKLPEAQYDRIHNTKNNLLQDVMQTTRMRLHDFKLLADKSLGSISTRLKNINPMIMHKLRGLDFNTSQKIIRVLRIAKPLLDASHNKMSKEDKSAWDWARKNSDQGKIQQLAEKYNLTEHVENLREELNRIRQEAIDVGYDVGFIDEYWPRTIKDQEGFLQATKGISERPVFTDAINAQADKLGITREEFERDYPEVKADIISNLILGRGLGIARPGNVQSRIFETIPEEYAKFYMDSDAALMQYIYSMTKKIEARKFFGKVPANIQRAKTTKKQKQAELIKQLQLADMARAENPEALVGYEESITGLQQDLTLLEEKLNKYKFQRDYTQNIGTYIDDLMVAEDKNPGTGIKEKDQKKLRNILDARFHEHGTTGLVNAYKNLAYIDTMGSPISALTQIGDLAWAMYVGKAWTPKGFSDTVKHVINATLKRSKITKEDLGIERIAQEFADGTTLSKAVSKVFKVVGLEKMDSIGKEVLINNALAQYQRQASTEAGRKKMLKDFQPIFGNLSNKVINDILATNDSTEVTDDVKFLLYSRLLDFQPVALSEMPEYYLSGGNGRLFYMLKTYTLKQFDVFRKEVWHNLKSGNTDQVISGLTNMVQLMALLTLANAGADELKDFMLGKETKFEDHVIENFLTLGGASRYVKMQVTREGLGSALAQQILPPFKFVNAFSKDVSGNVEDGLRSVESVPVGGKLYYWHFGRAAGNKKTIEEKDFAKVGKDIRKFAKKFDKAEDKKTFIQTNLDSYKQMKIYQNFQSALNRNKAVINKLEDIPQTANVRTRLGQLQEQRRKLINRYFEQVD